MSDRCKSKVHLEGKRFEYLTVLERADDYVSPSGNHMTRWLCRCDCGNLTKALTHELRKGQKKSCGCMHFKACKKFNQFLVDGGTVFVQLTNSDEPMACDVEDWDKMQQYCWSKNARGYAEARVDGRAQMFHMLIVDCPKGMVRDHINQNKLDNRKDNIRVTTYSINNGNRPCRNKFGIPGVSQSSTGLFYLRVKTKYGDQRYGGFNTLDEARKAYEGVINP